MKSLSWVLACLAVVLLVVPVDAQTRRPERPYRGVFGGTVAGTRNGHKVNARVSLFGSYDDNVIAGQGASPNLLGRVQTDGYYSGLTAALEYQRTGRKLSFGSDVGTAARYYPKMEDLSGLSPYANVFVNAALGKTTITASQQADYSPYYSLSFSPGIENPGITGIDGAIRAGESVALEERQAYGFNTAVTVTQTLTTRSSVIATYGWRRRDFKDESETDLTSHRGGVTYRHQVTRYSALRMGYGLEEANYRGALSASPRTRVHLLDIGADYRRPLSFSRRTTVDFKLGSTAIESGFIGERLYRFVGDAGLTHEIGRTWELGGAYHRGAGLIEGLAEPVFSDSVKARLTGFVNRRTELAVEAGYTEGEIGVTGFRNPFDSITGSARLQRALTPTLALFGDYLYYRYKFDDSYALPSGLPRNLNRQGVRVGLMLLLPVVK